MPLSFNAKATIETFIAKDIMIASTEQEIYFLTSGISKMPWQCSSELKIVPTSWTFSKLKNKRNNCQGVVWGQT